MQNMIHAITKTAFISCTGKEAENWIPTTRSVTQFLLSTFWTSNSTYFIIFPGHKGLGSTHLQIHLWRNPPPQPLKKTYHQAIAFVHFALLNFLKTPMPPLLLRRDAFLLEESMLEKRWRRFSTHQTPTKTRYKTWILQNVYLYINIYIYDRGLHCK